MYTDSRKAQHNSFAHQRAELLFSEHPPHGGLRKQVAASVEGETASDRTQSLRRRVSAGILGFVPMTATAGI